MQPSPLPNDETPIADLVMRDITKRKRAGIESYGVPLRSCNGRNSVEDLYEELLDAAKYTKQWLIEREKLGLAIQYLIAQCALHPEAEIPAPLFDALMRLERLSRSMGMLGVDNHSC